MLCLVLESQPEALGTGPSLEGGGGGESRSSWTRPGSNPSSGAPEGSKGPRLNLNNHNHPSLHRPPPHPEKMGVWGLKVWRPGF